MSKVGSWLAFALIVAGFIAYLAWEDQIKEAFSEKNGFKLTKVGFEDLAGNRSRLLEGQRGYVIFYADFKGCATCIRRLAYIESLREVYQDVHFAAIIWEPEQKNGFRSMLEEHGILCEVLVDPHRYLQHQMGLSEHSLLLFFNRHEALVGAIPLDLDHDKLERQMHRYIGEM